MNAKWKICHSIALLILLLCGCGESRPTVAESLDTQIEESWMVGHSRAEAVSFFARGGVYGSSPEFGDIDSRIVVPLVKQLRDECGLTVEVLQESDKPEIAFAIIADISEVEDRSKIAVICQAADREHPELVMENWGERWLSIDVLDESVTSHLRETGKLEPLMGHIERLRVKFGAKPADVE